MYKKVNMKTITIILAMMTSALLMASEPEPRFPDNIIKHVNSINKYPDGAKKYNIEGFVDVVIEITNEGRIVVSEYFGTDQMLTEHVLGGLKEVRMCPFDLSVGKKYKVRYSFDLM